MPRGGEARDLVNMKIRIERGDYEYLKKVLGLAGYDITSTVREIVGDLVRFFKTVFGEDLGNLSKGREFVIRQMVRLALVEMARAVSKVDEDVVEEEPAGEAKGFGVGEVEEKKEVAD